MIAKKLHLKPGMRVAVANAPAGFSLGKVAGVSVETSLSRDLDLALLFTTTQKHLKAQWPKVLTSVKQDGAIWVAYPKKNSGIATDLHGMQEWDATKGSDWNPVAMIAVDDAWSATRYKYAPGLEQARHERQTEAIRDADGAVVVDREKRVVTAPKDLRKLLAKNAKARAHFDTLAFSHRKEYVVWIVEAKKPETREARLVRTIEMLSKRRKNPSDK
jgi:agmatine/peptidylarginine deiminase